MTKNSSSVDAATFRAWAAEKLLVDNANDYESLRRAFLKVLDDEELVPYDFQAEAFLGIQQLASGQTHVTAPESFQSEARETALDQLNEFCREFLDISVRDRRQRFVQLLGQHQHIRGVRTRLKNLEPMLDFNSDSLRNESAEVRELAEWLIDFAGRTPYQRGLRRQQIREQCASEPAVWGRAAIRLRRLCPTVANSDRELFQQLLKGSNDPTVNLPRQLTRRSEPHSFRKQVQKFVSWAIVLLPMFVVGFAILFGLTGFNTQPSGLRNRPAHPDSPFIELKESKRPRHRRNRQKSLPGKPSQTEQQNDR